MDLPVGNGKQTEHERRETAKEMERMGEVESKAERVGRREGSLVAE